MSGKRRGRGPSASHVAGQAAKDVRTLDRRLVNLAKLLREMNQGWNAEIAKINDRLVRLEEAAGGTIEPPRQDQKDEAQL